MKTVVIWDDCEANLKFFVVDRDVSHLNGVYVNSLNTTEEQCAEASSLVYDDKGKQVIEMQDEFPVEAVKEGAKVITCGFLP